MKKRKILACILGIFMAITISSPVFAAEDNSGSLETAILSAKKIVSIPNEYNNFSYESNEYNLDNNKVKLWRLNWTEDDNNSNISVSIDDYGNLINYNKFDSSIEEKNLSKITKDQGLNIAEDFLGKVNPTYSEKMKNIDYNFNSSGEEYVFKFKQFENDIPVDFIEINIGVNKYTGQVESFNKSDFQEEFSYETPKNIISKDMAEQEYINKIDIPLKYYSNYDYKNKKLNIFAAYSIDYSNLKRGINGKSGEVINIYRDKPIGLERSLVNGVSASDNLNKNELTNEELEEVNNVSNIISKEQAEKIIKEKAQKIPSDAEVTSANLGKDSIDSKYIWTINFANGYGKVDGRTGELLGFNYYNKDNKGSLNISKDQAKNIAESFLKNVALEKLNQTKLIYEENNYTIDSLQDDTNEYSFKYKRIVNGIEFVSNGLNVVVDKTTGEVTSYTCSWYDNVEFPDITKVISKEDAFNKINETADFELQYDKISKDEIRLIYNFRNLTGTYLLDPLNGIRLNYNGKQYDDETIPNYTDITGNVYENTIRSLLENGYYIKGDKFHPNNYISQINFLKYLYSPIANNYENQDEFYEMLSNEGIIKKDEESPNNSITNEEAIKFIVRYLGYEKIAVNPIIFQNPFKNKIDDEYKGYAAIAYAIGIIKGDKNGNFNGQQYITNGQASQIIYNMLLQKQ